jgi:predicted kinase
MMRGLPASGKSTRAKEIIKASGNHYRINRDELRKMMFGELPWSGEREGLVIEIEKKIADTIFHWEKNVIIDDTNLTKKNMSVWKDFAIRHGMKFELEEMKTTLQECIKRDNIRCSPESVGEPIITRMALTGGIIPWPNKKIVICDIDGTLADCSHRLHYIQKEPKDWGSFLSEVEVLKDTPNEFIVKWLNVLYTEEYCIVIMSGRAIDKSGIGTVSWLRKCNIPYDFLFMRNRNDFREDYIVKEELLSYMPIGQIEFVIDDRMSVIRNCWRKNGIKCYPVSAGDGEF